LTGGLWNCAARASDDNRAIDMWRERCAAMNASDDGERATAVRSASRPLAIANSACASLRGGDACLSRRHPVHHGNASALHLRPSVVFVQIRVACR
jgi:hypothetical protein